MRKHIPNLLTLSNLVLGSYACVKVINGMYDTAALFVLLGLLFDFLDGFVARQLKVNTRYGKELDSFADLITFGLVPTLYMYQLLSALRPQQEAAPLIAFSIVAFSALRLAKFNLDFRQSTVFYGLPTPANAILIISLFFIWHNGAGSSFQTDTVYYFFVLVILLSSFLLISDIRLFSLKFKNFNWEDNKIRYLFLIMSIILLAVFNVQGLPIIIILYVMMSLISNLFTWLTFLD